MTLQRLYPRMAKFSDNAEALADAALVRPVMTAKEADLREKIWFGNLFGKVTMKGCTKATVTLDGRTIHGYAKSTNPREAGIHIYMSMLGTTLGVPTVPYIFLTGCRPRITKRHWHHKRNIRLFSAVPFDECERLCDVEGWQERTSIDPVSWGAASQYRAWIHDKDRKFWVNTVLADTGEVSMYDHEYADPLGRHTGVGYEGEDFIRYGSNLASNATKTDVYNQASATMAERIYSCPDETLDGIVKVMSDKVLINPFQVKALKTRRPMFSQAVVAPNWTY